jgi:hypothetical protein
MKTIDIVNTERKLLVDDEDFDRLNKFKWYLFTGKGKTSRHYYAMRIIDDSTTLFAHREIMGLKLGDQNKVDHKNGDGLDCQKKNMRACTHSRNMMNRPAFGRSKFKGVSFYVMKAKTSKTRTKDYPYWRASISVDKKRITKLFKKERDAAKWYNDMAVIYHGEFAVLNKLS